jgi:enoyl-CoA hydratase/carnithine racemase
VLYYLFARKQIYMPDIYVRQRDDILWLILNRHPHNLLTVSILEQFVTALQKTLHKSRPPRLIVITGTGEEAFCAGHEPETASTQGQQTFAQSIQTLDTLLRQVRVRKIPMVALVKGKALGAGCELAALCDTIIAREDALFRLPAPSEALFPHSIDVTFPAFMGKEATERLVQSGETLDAWTTMRLGLVQQVVPVRRFTQDVEELLILLAATAQGQSA